MVVGFIFTSALSFFQYRQVPMKLDYVPNAITGLTTLSGILTAFVGVWLSRQENPGDEETRKWMQERSVSIILVIVTGLLLVAGGLSSLVYQSLEFAFQVTMIGTLMVVWTVFDVLLFQVFSCMPFDKRGKRVSPST